MIEVEVAHANIEQQKIIKVSLVEGCTAIQAVEISGILVEFPELKEAPLELGIFAKPITNDTILSAGDRVEIYRPLALSPMQARRARVDKNKF